ncbi:glutaredoxin-like protein NrdH [Bartonella tamiae]|uniref:Glutaredoxin-like protein NrdH n=1 Tax=Bartonella tamiae Th239 TaxID=1094558 RepID=J1K2F6_9HYPH|nr:glutaredoxin-like protein NrdH [Bartonella tamiae]EJF91667.1 glutaredoxin-like protein NrdH [Bartonella tamiae Th239]
MVIVYSKPNYVQCTATKNMLDKAKIIYQVIDITKNEQAYSFVQSLGYKQVPVVTIGDIHWSGFQPDMLKKHITDQK